MAWQRVVDPQTGEERVVEVPEPAQEPVPGPVEVPQALTPAGVQGPVRPEGERIPFGAPTQQLDAIRREEPPIASLAPLEGMPPVRPVGELAVKQAENRPDYLARFGGPKRIDLAGKGFLGTLGEFATSDLGRNLIGALGVGLAGIRNPRDQGALQQQLMQMHFQGVRERQTKREQGEAMGGLYEALNNAHLSLAKGDLEGASNILAPLARNPAVLRSPEAMKALLAMQNQLTNRAASRHAVESLSKGPEPTSFRDFMTKASAAGMNLDDIIKLAPSMVRESKPTVIHSDKLGIWEYDPLKGAARQLVKAPKEGVGTPYKFSDMGDEAKKGFNWLMENNPNVNPSDFLGELNHEDPARRNAATRALGLGMAQVRQRGAEEEARKEGLKGGASRRLAVAEEDYASNPTSANKAALDIAKKEFGYEQTLAGGRRREGLEAAREEARATPTREFLKGGGAAFELKSGKYQEVSGKYRTKGELEDAEARGEVSIIPDRLGADKVAGIKNSLGTLGDLREIGSKVFTKETLSQIGKQGAQAWIQGLTGYGELGRNVRKLNVLRATVFDIAKGLGNDARISDADARFALSAMSLDTMFQAGESFRQNMDLVEKIFKRGLERAVRNERAPESERLSGGPTGSLSPEDLGKLKEILGVK